MGYRFSKEKMDEIFSKLSEDFDVFAPVVKKGDGTFSDEDVVRYDKVHSLDEIEFEKKSDYSFKEILLPINETVFYFTEDETIVPKKPEKERLVFLRSCDIHAVKRLDEIYLKNGFEDFYYDRIRKMTKFVLMGCSNSCETGFCASLGTNKCDNYDLYLKCTEGEVFVDVKDEELKKAFESGEKKDVNPDFVSENPTKVTLPKNITKDTMQSGLFKEYGSRCIKCGRCNFVCPTCTCFSMQDIFYKDNEKNGERRRVWASCQVDGYSQIAGGHEFRQDNSDRMRFKVMHKIYDFEKRFGYTMCVGCGRCDDVCPEYISYSTLINKLSKEGE
ncbi:anaerobic sulfite reductase subunit A [Acetitomaculum ruminis DSM 5522]|uniref:Anaerobic sulfite reductase subunit A n=1 Tax=Acetitomaculum ruminis DSM 5522 TaxID=1120918 RepID=A0A1I1AAY4_9FIRM|nr:anaerobic sulfite reductase subunit AsrA [Acetitomaculum ruminis]SFB35114.1 anaerobic sulfite reductase subunit A [Acetitomaculum ruminis DSM 5522]